MSLGVSSGSLSPTFAAGTVSYTLAIDNSVASVAFTPTVTHGAASLTVKGVTVISGSASSLIAVPEGGSNTVPIEVTSVDGNSTTTYNVVVARAPSSIATLSSLGNTGTLSPVFSPGTLAYTISLASDVASVDMMPNATSPLSTMTLGGVAFTSGALTNVTVKQGSISNTTIVVTAQDGVTSKMYQIIVSRAAASPGTSFLGQEVDLQNPETVTALSFAGLALLVTYSVMMNVYVLEIHMTCSILFQALIAFCCSLMSQDKFEGAEHISLYCSKPPT
jgi:hypothetical protein